MSDNDERTDRRNIPERNGAAVGITVVDKYLRNKGGQSASNRRNKERPSALFCEAILFAGGTGTRFMLDLKLGWEEN